MYNALYVSPPQVRVPAAKPEFGRQRSREYHPTLSAINH